MKIIFDPNINSEQNAPIKTVSKKIQVTTLSDLKNFPAKCAAKRLPIKLAISYPPDITPIVILTVARFKYTAWKPCNKGGFYGKCKKITDA